MSNASEETTGGQPETSTAARAARRTLTGVVISEKPEKTIVVETTRLVRHPKYGKVMRRQGRHMAHDEDGIAHEGDMVKIEETRPLSKRKRWRAIEVLRPGSTVTEQPVEGQE